MLLGYIIWLLGTFVNSSCDIKINIKIVKIAGIKPAVKGIKSIEILTADNTSFTV